VTVAWIGRVTVKELNRRRRVSTWTEFVDRDSNFKLNFS
jgi:hypothetical protein